MPTNHDTSPEALIGTTWEWISTITPIERIQATDPRRCTIQLNDHGGASYEIAENRITFGIFAATRMACPEDTQDFEFMSELERVATFFIRDCELFLETPLGSGTVRFRAGAQ